jgi:hypothetical protein
MSSTLVIVDVVKVVKVKVEVRCRIERGSHATSLPKESRLLPPSW